MSEDIRALFQRGIDKKIRDIRTPVYFTTVGEPIFEINDLTTTVNPIARLLRFIFLDKNITTNVLHEAHFESERATGKLLRDINTSRNNMIKALGKERMTVQQFERILDVLKLQILDLSYTIQDTKTGEVKVYSLSDIPAFLEKHNISLVDENGNQVSNFSYVNETL